MAFPVLGRLVADMEALKKAAAEIGYPVVLKANSEKIVHKSDLGAVRLNLRDEAELCLAHEEILVGLKKAGLQSPDNWLVQKMVKPGYEILIGAMQDPVFGSVTMVGQGGKYVELLKDGAPGIGILAKENVELMLDRTIAGKVLKGYRGDNYDRESVIDLTIKISKLMAENPQIHEIDLNPVIVHENGVALVDARVIAGDPVNRAEQDELEQWRIESLDNIFNAKSIAVVGASRTGTMGGIIFKNCTKISKVFPINPKLEVVQGYKCYPNLYTLPETPDVAVFALNPDATMAGFRGLLQAWW